MRGVLYLAPFVVGGAETQPPLFGQEVSRPRSPLSVTGRSEVIELSTVQLLRSEVIQSAEI